MPDVAPYRTVAQTSLCFALARTQGLTLKDLGIAPSDLATPSDAIRIYSRSPSSASSIDKWGASPHRCVTRCAVLQCYSLWLIAMWHALTVERRGGATFAAPAVLCAGAMCAAYS